MHEQYYGLKADQTPLIIIDNNDLDTRYFEAKIKPDQIAPWLEEYLVTPLYIVHLNNYIYIYIASFTYDISLPLEKLMSAGWQIEAIHQVAAYS